MTIIVILGLDPRILYRGIIMTYENIRLQAYEANMKIPENHLALYTWGNVSAFDKDKGVFAIKPSGVPYPELTPESMVIIDLDGKKVVGLNGLFAQVWCAWNCLLNVVCVRSSKKRYAAYCLCPAYCKG